MQETLMTSKETQLTPVRSPVSQALILVCEKCGRKLAGEGEENPAKALQLSLKERIKADGKKGVLRAVVTSCLDVCPKGEVTVGIVREGSREFFTLRGNVEHAAETVLDRLDR